MGAATALSLRYLPSAHAAAERLEVYKTPWCGCCTAWIDHMREAGFDVSVTELEDLDPLKARLGVVPELASCHTALIGGYVIEGHVPAGDVARLLAERPQATGLAVPGMPMGSPGMETEGPADAYEVVLFAPGSRETFARY
ncbi:MAG: DUF411 domain-containing protein [Parvibaculum sp.]